MGSAFILVSALAFGLGAAGAHEMSAGGHGAVSSQSGAAEHRPGETRRQDDGDPPDTGESERAAGQDDVQALRSRRPPPDPQNPLPDRPRPGGDRYALVIGNEHYRHYPDFSNGAAAAEAMAEHLSSAGYTLISGEAIVDASWRQIAQAMIELKAVSREGGVGVLYYSGHTFALGGDNYLVAADTLSVYDDGFPASLFPLDTLWSFPRERPPGVLFSVLETNGMLGLFRSPTLQGSGTGLNRTSPPEEVVLAISDSLGPITLWPVISLQSGAPRGFWSRTFGTGEAEIPPFTRLIMETEALTSGDPLARLREVALRIAETSLLSQRPAIVSANREPFNLEPFRDEFERAAEALANGPAPVVESYAGESLGGIDLIKMFEGLRLEPYRDSARIATIGYGHTGNVSMQDAAITRDEAIALLDQDLEEARLAIETSVSVDLNQNQHRALTSFVFNVGAQAFRGSTLLELINAGETVEAAAEMLRWIHVNRYGEMRESNGLAMRREAEAFLFIIPVDVDDEDSLIALLQAPEQPISQLDMARFAAPSRRTELCLQCEPEAPQSLTRQEHAHTVRQIHSLVEQPLTLAQLLALSSFIDRVGLEHFYRSPVYQRLKSGDVAGAASALAYGGNEFDQGVQVGGQVVRRRSAETALFFATVTPPEGEPLSADGAP